MPRWLWVATGTASKTRSISPSSKPASRSRCCERSMTISWAHGQAVMPWASTPTTRRVPSGGRHSGAEQRVDLLRGRAGGGRRLVLWIAGRDGDLGAHAVLAVAHALGDVSGKRLGLEGLAEDHLVDRLVDDLLEARHVRALLVGAEIDEALELGVEELLASVGADADDLLDAGHADAREAHVGRGAARLDVAAEEVRFGSLMAAMADCTWTAALGRQTHEVVYTGRGSTPRTRPHGSAPRGYTAHARKLDMSTAPPGGADTVEGARG